MRPNILVDATEAFWHDSDNAEVDAIDAQRVPDDSGIGRELSAPEIEGKHRNWIPSRNGIFVREKSTPEDRLNSEHLKEITAHGQRTTKMSAIARRLRDTHSFESAGNEAIERMRLIAEIAVVRI